MTITFTIGDILADPAQAIVIPVNTVGVPGAGLARSWAKKFPVASSAYKSLCKENLIKIGNITMIQQDDHRWIMFPTKEHWKDRSRVEWIKRGLVDLQRNLSGFKSLAIPALGCGLGGLRWSDVKTLIEKQLSKVDIPITVYSPKP